MFTPSAYPRICVRRSSCVAALLLALFSRPAAALDPDRSIGQFHHTAWTAKDGAPSQISALVQSTDGFLWIGTSRGLFRFDGVQFERYTPPPGVTLPAHNIYALQATSDGGLWISFRPSGLGFLKDGMLSVFDKPGEIPSSQVYIFAADREGRVWAGTHDGLDLRSGGTWIEVGDAWGLPDGRVWSLLADRGGSLWVGMDKDLWLLRHGSMKFDLVERSKVRVKRMTEASDGAIWISELARPLRRLVLAENGVTARDTDLRFGSENMLFDRDGTLWITDLPYGIKRIAFPDRMMQSSGRSASLVDSYQARDGLSANGADQLLEDKEGTIWVGTTKGLDRFRYSHVVPVRLPSEHQLVTLVAAGEGELWVGSAFHKALVQVRDDSVTAHPSPSAASVLKDASGVVWWGGSGGIWRRHDGRIERFRQPAELRLSGDGQVDQVWEVIPAGDGALWIGLGDIGLIHFQDGVWSRRALPEGLLARVPSASYPETQERAWFGYTENRVALLDHGVVTRYTQDDGIDVGRIRVIRGRGPAYWFGGELGLAVFHDGKFRSVLASTGERFDTVSGIIETADGTLWLNEMRGIVRIPSEEARRVAVDPDHRINYQVLDFLDGLPGSPQMNFTVSTAVEGSDGRLWFATDNGLAYVRPERLVTNEVLPPVVIRSISTESRTYELAPDLRLPQGTPSLRIDYTALSLSIPERVQFHFRLQGYDDHWRDAGNARAAFYTGLRPGKYRFEVIASNQDGVWNLAGASTVFSVAPAFYQTAWFLGLCGLAAVGSLWLFYLMRVRQIAARVRRFHEERNDERMRIAHELHDTLLQGVLSASMQLHVAAGSIPDGSPAKSQLRHIMVLMGELVGDARNTVRSLRTSGAPAPELEQAFARIEQELPIAGKVDFRVVVNGKPRPLDPVIRDEVYRIGRESLLNAIRHADARAIDVELDYLPAGLNLVVRDDGGGIEPGVLEAGREGHYGITGMRERAARMGAKLAVRSRPGSGTEVELSVPGRVAFADGARASVLRRMSRWARAKTNGDGAAEE